MAIIIYEKEKREKMLTISTDHLEEVLIRTGTNLELKLKLDLNITHWSKKLHPQ